MYKGGKHSTATRQKMREAKLRNHPKYWLGKKRPPRSKEWREKHNNSLRGKPSSYYGEKHWAWKGGITNEKKRIRSSLEYKIWRRAVFERDKFQCIWGGKEHGNKLEADHIKPFAFFPELRFAIDNGRTLCRSCHRKTDTWGQRIYVK